MGSVVEDKLRQTIRTLESEKHAAVTALERFQNAGDLATLTRIADKIFALKGVWNCIIQHGENTWNRKNHASGASSGTQYDINERETVFRVFLVTTKEKMADRSCPTLKQALEECFEAVGLTLPKDLLP